MTLDREVEMEQIKAAVDAILNHFGKYKIECDRYWPHCWRHPDVTMTQIFQKGTTTYYQCFETEDGHVCRHKEFGI